MTLPQFKDTQALIFDLMGTCADWHSHLLSVLSSCPPLPPSISHAVIAADWRAGFFDEIHARFEKGLGGEDIDVTHRRVLDRLLGEKRVEGWDEEVRMRLVRSWHDQQAWPDAIEGIERLKKKFFIVVLANGTTRLQLDIVRSSGLPFHTLFSSQLLGLTKPDPKIYLKALDLIALPPEKCIMVAAHAYDLRAAAKVGMKTIYIQRTTEDRDENMEALKGEFDAFIDGTTGGPEDGLVELAKLLGV